MLFVILSFFFAIKFICASKLIQVYLKALQIFKVKKKKIQQTNKQKKIKEDNPEQNIKLY